MKSRGEINLKEKYEMIFIILCYKEHKDLENLLANIHFEIKISRKKIVVVNSFFDEDSKKIIERIALKNNCDFINVDNKGYGYGNNRGIEFVEKNYNYNFLCICNPDIEFNEFDYEDLFKFSNEAYIVAPQINVLSGKNQNPYYYKKNKLVNYFKYIGFQKNIKAFYYLAVVINKLSREIMLKNNVDVQKIYACHGSCFFISQEAIKKTGLIYNEKMFLFNEEEHLAKLAEKHKIETILNRNIKILHYEDGSSEDIVKTNKVYEYLKESYLINYKNWNDDIE